MGRPPTISSLARHSPTAVASPHRPAALTDVAGPSPSPPEPQEPSPKSTNSSPRSSNSSPPAVKHTASAFQMTDTDFDFSMLDHGNLPPLLSDELKQDGMDVEGVNELSAQYFDFESAASSPLGLGKVDKLPHNIPRFFPAR